MAIFKGDDILDKRLYGTSKDDNLYGYTGLNWYMSSSGNNNYFGGPGSDRLACLAGRRAGTALISA